jgi:GNAT-like C-terminal domain/N-acyltransferase N-terminal domain
VRRWHERQGIAEDVSWATMADLGRHVARHRRRQGTTGLDTQWWIGIHFRGAMYQLGRLQFNPYRLRTGMAGPRFWYDGEAGAARGPGFQPGDPVLGVHIPAGSGLDPDACDESFAMAGPFFRRHFPAAAGAIATCTSWLLDEQLAEHLPSSSNIVRFQRRFELVPGAAVDDDEVFAFVFDRGAESLDELPQTTELERVMVRHVRDGGHWRVRTGWLRV